MKVDKHRLLQEYTIREILDSGLVEYLGLGGLPPRYHNFRCNLCHRTLRFRNFRWIIYHMSQIHPSYYYVWRKRAIVNLLKKTTLGLSVFDGKYDPKILRELRKGGKIALVKLNRGIVVLLR